MLVDVYDLVDSPVVIIIVFIIIIGVEQLMVLDEFDGACIEGTNFVSAYLWNLPCQHNIVVEDRRRVVTSIAYQEEESSGDVSDEAKSERSSCTCVECEAIGRLNGTGNALRRRRGRFKGWRLYTSEHADDARCCLLVVGRVIVENILMT